MKISYEEHMKDRIEMPIFDESIFYSEIKRRKFGISDEEMESVVEYFRSGLTGSI
ncbi:MAG: hypothetical protein IPK04_14215 [Bdellovibrionales bacterium]|nr:hypothetical protein [Bdellovibrionales bacterium]